MKYRATSATRALAPLTVDRRAAGGYQRLVLSYDVILELRNSLLLT